MAPKILMICYRLLVDAIIDIFVDVSADGKTDNGLYLLCLLLGVMPVWNKHYFGQRSIFMVLPVY